MWRGRLHLIDRSPIVAYPSRRDGIEQLRSLDLIRLAIDAERCGEDGGPGAVGFGQLQFDHTAFVIQPQQLTAGRRAWFERRFGNVEFPCTDVWLSGEEPCRCQYCQENVPRHKLLSLSRGIPHRRNSFSVLGAVSDMFTSSTTMADQ